MLFIRASIALAASLACTFSAAQQTAATPAAVKAIKPQAAADAAVKHTEAQIKAELSKPITTPLAEASPEPASTGGNRFITRPGTGSVKAVRAAPAIALPEGPLGKPSADVTAAIAEAQKAAGQPLDPYQREINLPGLKKDDPATRPTVLHTRNGVNEIVRLSSRLPNRIATPFAKPVVVGDVPEDETQVVGSDVYLRPLGEQPLGLFIVDGSNTSQAIALTVIPAGDIPGQNLIVKLEDLRTVNSLIGSGASPEELALAKPKPADYVGNVRRIMTAAARGKIPGFTVVPVEGGVAKLGPIEVTPEYAFSGSTIDVYRYHIKNASNQLVDLVETAFYRKGVKAVSFFPKLALEPGEDSYVFLLADKPKSAAAFGEVSE